MLKYVIFACNFCDEFTFIYNTLSSGQQREKMSARYHKQFGKSPKSESALIT